MVAFTWYGMAKEVGMNRSTLLRAARALGKKHILTFKDGTIGIQTGTEGWCKPVHSCNVAPTHLMRCSPATLFRRAKESSKERYKDKHHMAGAAHPVAGKYDGHAN